jgi:hypothetical protein
MPAAPNINRSLVNKKIDNFYVSFFQLPENIGNILGRQVASIERPSPTFTPIEIRKNGVKQQQIGSMEFADIAVTFKDDNYSLVVAALYQQLYRQAAGDASRFAIGVKAYDAEDTVIEEFTLTNCYIVNISHTENIYSSSTDNQITVSIAFDTVDYKFLE